MGNVSDDAYGNQTQAVLLSYLGGIVDGEGHIGMSKIKGHKTVKHYGNQSACYSVRIAVGMVDPRVPELLHKTFGGSCTEERVPDRRSMWRWSVGSRKKALTVLSALHPYLIVKRRQAEVLMDYCSICPAHRRNYGGTRGGSMTIITEQEILRREEAWQTLRKLNATGAAATTNQEDTREGEVMAWTPNGVNEPRKRKPERRAEMTVRLTLFDFADGEDDDE